MIFVMGQDVVPWHVKRAYPRDPVKRNSAGWAVYVINYAFYITISLGLNSTRTNPVKLETKYSKWRNYL